MTRFLAVTSAVLLTVLPVSSAPQAAPDAPSLVRDWQCRFDAVARESYVVDADWVRVLTANGARSTGTLRFASTPRGEMYFRVPRSTDPNDKRTRELAFDGKTLTASINEDIFNRMSRPQNISGPISAVYQFHYGFAFAPSRILVNPALRSEKTPTEMGKRITSVQRVSPNRVRAVLSRTEADGARVPSSIDFVRRDGSYFPKKFTYAYSDGNTEVIFDEIKPFGSHALPTRYRYIQQSTSPNPEESSVTTYTLRYRRVADKSLFRLRPTANQRVVRDESR